MNRKPIFSKRAGRQAKTKNLPLLRGMFISPRQVRKRRQQASLEPLPWQNDEEDVLPVGPSPTRNTGFAKSHGGYENELVFTSEEGRLLRFYE